MYARGSAGEAVGALPAVGVVTSGDGPRPRGRRFARVRSARGVDVAFPDCPDRSPVLPLLPAPWLTALSCPYLGCSAPSALRGGTRRSGGRNRANHDPGEPHAGQHVQGRSGEHVGRPTPDDAPASAERSGGSPGARASAEPSVRWADVQVNDSSSAPQQIPAMRLPREIAPGRSATPLYDELCAEYRRLGRALPGDRSGEEHLRYPGSGAGTVHCARGGAVERLGWRVGRPWRVALPPAPQDGDGSE